MTPEVIGLFIVVLTSIAGGAVAWGRLSRAHEGLATDVEKLAKHTDATFDKVSRDTARADDLRDLEQRHGESTKEMRERASALEGRVNMTEKVLGLIDMRLDQIRGDVTEIKGFVAPRPQQRRK